MQAVESALVSVGQGCGTGESMPVGGLEVGCKDDWLRVFAVGRAGLEAGWQEVSGCSRANGHDGTNGFAEDGLGGGAEEQTFETAEAMSSEDGEIDVSLCDDFEDGLCGDAILHDDFGAGSGGAEFGADGFEGSGFARPQLGGGERTIFGLYEWGAGLKDVKQDEFCIGVTTNSHGLGDGEARGGREVGTGEHPLEDGSVERSGSAILTGFRQRIRRLIQPIP